MDELVARAAGSSMLLFSRKGLAPDPTTITTHIVQTNENRAKDPALVFMDSRFSECIKER